MSYLCIILKQPDILLKGVEITISNRNEKQEKCIPVGCVPPACCLYLPACIAPEGVYLVWGGIWSRGVGGSTWSGGVYLVPEGVPGPGGVPGLGVYLV